MLEQVVGRHCSRDAFHRCNSISAGHRWMGSVQVSGLHFHIAHTGLARKPVLACEQGSVGIRKCAPGGNRDQVRNFLSITFTSVGLGATTGMAARTTKWLEDVVILLCASGSSSA